MAGPVHQQASCAPLQQGGGGGGSGSLGSGGSAVKAEPVDSAAANPQPVKQEAAAQQQQPAAEGGSGQSRLRKKVPRIYFATRTHSQIAQVSRVAQFELRQCGLLLGCPRNTPTCS